MGNIFWPSKSNHPLVKDLKVNKWNRAVFSTGFGVFGMTQLEEEKNNNIIKLHYEYDHQFAPIDFSALSGCTCPNLPKIEKTIKINMAEFNETNLQKALFETPELNTPYSKFYAESLFYRFVDSDVYRKNPNKMQRNFYRQKYLCNFDYDNGKGMCFCNLSSNDNVMHNVSVD